MKQAGHKQQAEISQDVMDEFAGFIHKEASKFKQASSVCDINDLKQAGYIGLISAFNTFKQHKDFNAKARRDYFMTAIHRAIVAESIKFLPVFTMGHVAAFDFYKLQSMLNNKCSKSEIRKRLKRMDSYIKNLETVAVSSKRDMPHSEIYEDNQDGVDYVIDIMAEYSLLSKKEKEFLDLCSSMKFSDIDKKCGKNWSSRRFNKIINKFNKVIKHYE